MYCTLYWKMEEREGRRKAILFFSTISITMVLSLISLSHAPLAAARFCTVIRLGR